jgi:hypothetical protein
MLNLRIEAGSGGQRPFALNSAHGYGTLRMVSLSNRLCSREPVSLRVQGRFFGSPHDHSNRTVAATRNSVKNVLDVFQAS